MIKIGIGIVIIVLSFVYLMKNRNQSLMDALMFKGRKQMEELEELEASEASETLGNQETPEEDPK